MKQLMKGQKNQAGRNGFATYEPAPPLVPGIEISITPDRALRKSA